MFPRVSSLYNEYNHDVQKNVAPITARKITAPHLLARSPESEVSQLEELLFNAFGYDQYQESPRGDILNLSPKNIFDARLKLFEMPLIARAIQHYYPSIHRSTYFWRRIIDDLSLRRKPDIQQTSFSVMSNLNPQDYIIQFFRFRKELMNIDQYEQQFILHFDEKGNPVAKSIYEAEQPGILVFHHRTNLTYNGIPINFFESTRDKRLIHYLRKMWERDNYPEDIHDAYGTAIIIDTVTDEIRVLLKAKYSAYRKEQKTNKNRSLSYEKWLDDWSKNAIRLTLIDTIKQIAAGHNYSFNESQRKDILDTTESTGGSAASAGGYHELKFYAEIDQINPLSGKEEKSEELEEIEITVYPNIQNYLLKIFGSDTVRGDLEYNLLRREIVEPGSGKYPLWKLEYPPHIYSHVYPWITAYEAHRRDQTRQKENRRFLEGLFGLVKGTLFS